MIAEMADPRTRPHSLWLRGILGLLIAAFQGPVYAQALSSSVEAIYRELDALPAAERAARVESGARKEARITILQTLHGELGDGQIDLFRKRYPFIAVDSSSQLSSPEAAERVYAEEVSDRHLTDAINVAIIDMPELLAHDFLARYRSPAIANVLPAFRKYADPEGRWTLSFWSDRGISYNTELVPAELAPHVWQDLCRPFFKGNVSFESMQIRFLAGLYSAFGDKIYDYFRCLGDNDPIIQGSPSERVALMLAGDHMVVGDSYLYAGIAEKRRNPSAPDGFALPGPLLASFGGVGINRNAPHPFAAALFADWMLTEEAQSYLARRLRGPVTLKHPYLPDDAQLVVTPLSLPDGVSARLIEAWKRDVEKKR